MLLMHNVDLFGGRPERQPGRSPLPFRTCERKRHVGREDQCGAINRVASVLAVALRPAHVVQQAKTR